MKIEDRSRVFTTDLREAVFLLEVKLGVLVTIEQTIPNRYIKNTLQNIGSHPKIMCKNKCYFAQFQGRWPCAFFSIQ